MRQSLVALLHETERHGKRICCAGCDVPVHARDLHLVMGSSDPAKPIRFRVKIDSALPGTDHGLDVDAKGRGSVQEPQLYQLVRQSRSITDRTFEIEFFDAGSRAYALTFG